MRDKTKRILLPENPFEKIHGHTKIELTDIHTGEKKVIEHDNDFQAGVLAKCMRSMGAYNNNPYANSTWAGQPIWRNLCGGILCFENEIDNSNNEVEYMPAGNSMTANGAYMIANAGTPIELGSYNSAESQTDGNDSITFVYEWLTSQGNGTISCVCLTTEIGGYIGYGNKSGERHETTKSFATNQSCRAITGLQYKNNVYSFTLDSENSKISVTKKPTELTKGSIFDNIAEDSFDVTYSGTVSGTAISQIIYMGNGKVALFPYHSNTQSLANGATYSFLIYDLEADTATVKTITNNTGTSLRIRLVYSNWPFVPIYGITEDNIYLVTGSGTEYPQSINLYSISLSDNSYHLIIESVRGTHATNIPLQNIGVLSSQNLFICRNSIYDETANTVYPINGVFDYGYQYTDEHDVLFNPNTGGCYKNPLILATINNLDTPVTKTAAQTMKITYTLTKASE